VLDQVIGGSYKTFRIVAELPEPGIARATDQPAERSTAVVVVDVQTLFSARLPRCPSADSAPFSATHCAKYFRHLGVQAQHPDSTAKTMGCVLLGVGAFPRPFFRQRLRFPFRRAQDVLGVRDRGDSLALLTSRSRFRRSTCSDPKRGDFQSAFTGRTDARFAYLPLAREAQLGDDALQAAAPTRALIVADPFAAAVIFAPLSNAARFETALEALLRCRQLASTTPRALVVQLPVTIGMQPEPAAAGGASPTQRLRWRSRRLSHVVFDGADRARIRRAA
jgi:hypothetical protein